ncbi:MAG: protein-disulfide reductase DsbD [Candidatus Eisenbacteria bacterium]|nr:protein-disulfide reductase DsbD [Candidatus Eisenbacteria bacterium]
MATIAANPPRRDPIWIATTREAIWRARFPWGMMGTCGPGARWKVDVMAGFPFNHPFPAPPTSSRRFLAAMISRCALQNRFVLSWIATSVLLIGLSVGWSAAQDAPEIGVEVHLSHAGIPAGGSATAAAVLQIPPNNHVQVNDFLSAKVIEPEGVQLGPLALPPAQQYEGDPVYLGRLVLRAPLTVAESAPPGQTTLKVAVGYQSCSERPAFMCFPPDERVVEVALEVLPASAEPIISADAAVSDLGLIEETAGRPDGEVVAEEGDLAGRVESALAEGSWLAFLLVFVGGVAMSFTPCVYPMIPITISFVGGRSRGKLNGFVLSLFFVLGIAITYSALGVIAAQTGALFGSAMQSTPVLLLVAAVLMIMGVSMLGAFDIALPSSVQTRMQGGARKGGFIGAILMGMVTGLVASPCVGPVLIVLLAWVAKAGSTLMGFWLLFVFATGLGMLFLVLGTFAGAINALPRSGEWMATVKHVFGVILLGMGLYYLKPIIGDTLFWILLGGFSIFVATFTGAFHRLPEEPAWGMQFRKGLGVLLLVAGVFLLAVGLAHTGYLPLGGGSGGEPMAGAVRTESGPDWHPTDEAALSEARAAGKPVLLDFYADWCAACKELDEETWTDPAVARELQRFVLAKLDFTRSDAALEAKRAEYGVQGLPTVILLDSDQQEVHRFAGFKGPEEVLELLREVG